MDFEFSEVKPGNLGTISTAHQEIYRLVDADNDPPDFLAAQTCYVLRIDAGVLVRAQKFQNAASAFVEFEQDDEWNYAVIPNSITRGGAVLSYSVLHKLRDTACRDSTWLKRLSTRLHFS